MLFLSGADLVLPDRVLSPGTLAIDGDRIVEVLPGERSGDAVHEVIPLRGQLIVPGFVDVHMHGLEGRDVLEGGPSLQAIAARLPRYGVVAFCPTSVACPPADLAPLLRAVETARRRQTPGSARVLPAHLESNFINPEYAGAQPASCLRLPPILGSDKEALGERDNGVHEGDTGFRGEDVLAVIERWSDSVGIVTLAPELPDAIALIRRLVGQGIIVSLGHSAASLEEAEAGIGAGARHATHLFNRMPPLRHRQPGLAGAALTSPEVVPEIICDAFHVHPAFVRLAVAAKRPQNAMAITDGTAAAGLAVGARARLGRQSILVGESAAHLEDGTIAGSILTMDRAFRMLVGQAGVSLADAAQLCATTPARRMRLDTHIVAAGAVADLTVLDPDLNVTRTYIGGSLAFSPERLADV